MSHLELLLTYLQSSESEPANEQIRPVANAFMEMLSRSRNDPVPGVAAWGAYLTATLAAAGDRTTMLQHMAKSDYWPRRLLAVVDARRMTNNAERELVKTAMNDPKARSRNTPRR